MRLGIVGGGTVGHATARAFLGHVEEVLVYDVGPLRRTHTLIEALDCDLTMVCLPTPQREGSLECDLSAVEGFFAGLTRQGRLANLVLKSTVPVGTTRRLRERYDLPNLVHSPEFLNSRTAEHDAANPSHLVIGCDYSGSPEGYPAKSLLELYSRRFPDVPIYTMSSAESEFVKLATNGFFAVKVAYWNEARTLADRLGLRWDDVMTAVLADGRINPNHTRVPGHDGYGFAGTCLPKDLANLIDCMDRAEVHPPPWVTRSAHERNRFDRRRQA